MTTPYLDMLVCRLLELQAVLHAALTAPHALPGGLPSPPAYASTPISAVRISTNILSAMAIAVITMLLFQGAFGLEHANVPPKKCWTCPSLR